jgi:pSer/pThr/pTyr-binding forkhead associated (FHA) protein
MHGMVIGRNDDCDLRLEHKSVSKLHCIIVKADGLLLIRDLGSTNGTRVNGQRVRRAALLPNDSLHVANVKYLVKFGVLAEPEENATAEPPPGPATDAAPLKLNVHPDVYPESNTPHS